MLMTKFTVLQLALLKICPEGGLCGGAVVTELFAWKS